MQAISDPDVGAASESIATSEASSQSQPSPSKSLPTPVLSRRALALLLAVALCALAVLIARFPRSSRLAEETAAAAPDRSNAVDSSLVRLDEEQMSSITLESVTSRGFLAEKVATGKIGFNEDLMTPVFSPYTGRIIRLLAKPGDGVKRGATLFEIDTPDLVQAGQDLIAANISVPRARTLLELATRAEDRAHRLYLNKAVALKDWEQTEADLRNAERDLHSAESALVAARSRLRVFGKSDEEIAKIENDRQVDRTARVLSPIQGTIVARKVGPGQYVKPDSADPLFTIADLSTVWLLADMYESDAPLIKVGQKIEVRVAAYPNDAFTAHIAYVNPSVDPTTHRVGLRSVVENRGHRLKPEMFASFRVVTNSETSSAAVPTAAIVRDGDKTRVWVARDRNQFVRKDVTVGIQQGGYVQILSGLEVGEKVVSAGGVLIGNAGSS